MSRNAWLIVGAILAAWVLAAVIVTWWVNA